MKRVLVLVVMLGVIVSCATTNKSSQELAISNYARLVSTFNIIGDGLKQMCIDGVISQSDCQKIKIIHDRVADALDRAGYILELSISVDDPEKISFCAPFVKPCNPDDLKCHEENVNMCLNILSTNYDEAIDIATTGLQQLRQYYLRKQKR